MSTSNIEKQTNTKDLIKINVDKNLFKPGAKAYLGIGIGAGFSPIGYGAYFPEFYIGTDDDNKYLIQYLNCRATKFLIDKIDEKECEITLEIDGIAKKFNYSV